MACLSDVAVSSSNVSTTEFENYIRKNMRVAELHKQSSLGLSLSGRKQCLIDRLICAIIPPAPHASKRSSLEYLYTYFFWRSGEHVPFEMVIFWQGIFEYVDPSTAERIDLRRLCNTFNVSLKSSMENMKGVYTIFPHLNHASLDSLMNRLNDLYDEDPTKAPSVILIMEGDHEVIGNYLLVKYPLKIMGAGRNKTFLHGGGFHIKWDVDQAFERFWYWELDLEHRCHEFRENGTQVELSGMTVSGAKKSGLYSNNSLCFLCKNMTFIECDLYGVIVYSAYGRFINCVITKCGRSGVRCEEYAMIELEGSQTKVDGNVTRGGSSSYGLKAFDASSAIYLRWPLTEECVSSILSIAANFGGDGVIAIVDNEVNDGWHVIIEDLLHVSDDESDDESRWK